MADPTLVFRVAANLSAMKTNLAEGVSQLEVYKSALKTASGAFDGSRIVQQASAAAIAIQNAGGVTSLTSAEMTKANAVFTAASEKLRLIGQAGTYAGQTFTELAAQTKQATGWFDDLGNTLKATAIGMVSAQAAIELVKESWRTLSEFVSSSVTAYANAELAERKMTAAMQAQGTATALNIQDQKDLAEAFQRTTVNSHVATMEMEALLTQVGNIAPSAMKKTLQAAMDLSAGLGIDLRAAVIAVSKASEDNITALKKAGLQLDETRVKGEGLDYILGAIEQRFGGQALTELDTYSGKIKKLGNDWDDVKEAIGRSLVQDPLVAASIRAVSTEAEDAAKGTSSLKQAWIDASGTLPDWVNGLVSVAEESAKVNNELADLSANINKLKPPPPKVFTDFGDDFKALNAEASKLVKDMVAGWKEEDASAERTLAKEIRELKERDDAFNRSAALQTKLIGEIMNEQLKAGATANELAKIALDNRMAEEIAAARASKNATQQEIDNSVALIKVKYKGLADEIGVDWAAISASSQKTADEQRDNAQKTYIYMIEHADQYTHGALQAQLDKVRELTAAATAQGRASAEGQAAAEAAAKKQNDELEKQKKIAEALVAANEALIRSRSSTQDLPVLRQGDLDRAIGGHDTNAIQQAILRIEEKYRANPGRRSGGNGSTGVNPGDAAGWEQLNAERTLYAQLQAALANLPKFGGGVRDFSGGMALVGERGPEIVNLPSGADVIPNQSLGGATIHQTYYVNGTGEEVYRFVKNAMMKDLKSSRMLGAS